MKELKLEIEKLIETNMKLFDESFKFRENWSEELKLSFSNFIDVSKEIISLQYHIEKDYDIKFLYKYLKSFNKILQEKVENNNQDSKLYEEFYNFLRDYDYQSKCNHSTFSFHIWDRLPKIEWSFFIKHSFDFTYILGFDILFRLYDTIWTTYSEGDENETN